ncbi:hypothetical protein NE237_024323 [Protea cynaroides]|uniref:AB hydrolase-1 domain-containing protein n=1 Tax=Protea cynaroides TaxID=273540 RepID=A0A9Q0K5B3_9MAGN|nr:hypothetical protein NE237_024323 [Protea cynaroides]
MVHFVLVHGLCHGTWCWYKVRPVLESAGHRVTALDLAASGINMNIHDLRSMSDYTRPLLELMASIPPGEKVTLVGHSLGGLNIALAMDNFPRKISAAVFLTAFMPDTTYSPSYVIDKSLEGTSGDMLDTQFSTHQDPGKSIPITKTLFGPKKLASKIGSLFQEDLSKRKAFSKEGYDYGNRIFILCKKDLAITEDFQHWMIENNPVKEVMEIEDADHMAMMSTPNQLCYCLLDIANKYT